MEATKLKIKKQINKGKLKKTMKNVICRPDPTFWPITSDDEGKVLHKILRKHKIQVPDFKKPAWNEISNIRKELRPKPPPLLRINGLIFGIADCLKLIERKECAGVIIEALVNPRTIVQSLLETCSDQSIPILCLRELRNESKINFGIPTTALGVKQNCLPELEKVVVEISKYHRPPRRQAIVDKGISINVDQNEEVMDVVKEFQSPYLYRVDKKSRVFTPLAESTTIDSNKFGGQNFIKLSDSTEQKIVNSKQYMKMIVKKISSNPNRKKVTKVTEN